MDKTYHKILLFLKTLVNILVVIISLPKIIAFKRSKISGKGCVHVLGNGPSLKSDFPKLISSITASDTDSVLVVNSFSETEYFEILKPQYYFLVDPSFFKDDNIPVVAEIKRKTAEGLINKTKWDLHLFIPYSARNCNFILNIKKNKFIDINYFMNVPIVDGIEKVNHFFYRHGFANPPYRNVLIASVFNSIVLKFSKIAIWGADHSWHENIFLGNDNMLYNKDTHFYGEDSKGFLLCDHYGNPVRVHDEFFSIARALKLYHSLEKFSQLYNCKIVNRSSKTWIDAFERE